MEPVFIATPLLRHNINELNYYKYILYIAHSKQPLPARMLSKTCNAEIHLTPMTNFYHNFM